MPYYNGVWISNINDWEALNDGRARMDSSGKIVYKKYSSAQSRSKYSGLKGKSTYQIPDSYLRKIYGNPTLSKGRPTYKGAYLKSGRLQEYLKPLGIGEKVEYKETTRNKRGSYSYQRGEKIQTINRQRYVGNLEWNKNGTLSNDPSRTSGKWEASGAKSGNLTGKQWATHLLIAAHELEINTVNFVQVMTRYAKRVFEKSFEIQRFYSKGAPNWIPLRPSTKRIRESRGVLSQKILIERRQLMDSLDLDFGFVGGAFSGAVYTKTVNDRNGGQVCYAAIHNEADGTYTLGNENNVLGRRIPTTGSVQRQFMGHSTYIESFATKIRNKYFLDAVFTLAAK